MDRGDAARGAQGRGEIWLAVRSSLTGGRRKDTVSGMKPPAPSSVWTSNRPTRSPSPVGTRADARAKFGARSKKEARKTALGIVETLIYDYFDQGQPYNEALEDDVPKADADRLRDALDRIASSLLSMRKGERR